MLGHGSWSTQWARTRAGELLCSGSASPTDITVAGVPGRTQEPQSRAWASAFQQAALSGRGCREGAGLDGEQEWSCGPGDPSG